MTSSVSRMRKTVIIDGHPDPDRAHLNHALADRYAEAAQAAGHEIRRINVAELDIPLLRVPSEFYNDAAPQTIRDAQRDIAWADHVMFFFPLWHGYMPAALKAFVEQIFRPGYAMEYRRMGWPKRLLEPKSARIVVTMGMPAFFYRAYFGAHGVKAFELSVLRFAGVGPICTTLLGGAGEGAQAKAGRWMALMEVLAQRDGKSSAPKRRPWLWAGAKTAAALAGASAAGMAAWRYSTSRRG